MSSSSSSSSSSLQVVLDDLAARFIINLPSEELESGLERICFQLEQAHWFYVDFVQPKDASLPALSLDKFARKMFEQCALLRPHASQTAQILKSFSQYKQKVPVCGAIVFNADMSKVLMVKGWGKSASWSFPRGKMNQSESKLACAVREVREETGFDITPFVVADDLIDVRVHDAAQEVTLFTVPCVPESTPFLPQTRQEISDIKWFFVTDLDVAAAGKSATQTKSFYLLKPFLKGIRAYSNRVRASLSLPPLFSSGSTIAAAAPAAAPASTPKKKQPLPTVVPVAATATAASSSSSSSAAAPVIPVKRVLPRAQSSAPATPKKASAAAAAPASPVALRRHATPAKAPAATPPAAPVPLVSAAELARSGDAWLDFRFDVGALLACFDRKAE